jgi:hypothetical protein
LQVPFAHVVLPLRVVVPPAGPVNVCVEAHEPPAHEPEPDELQLLPLGPVPLPLRDQPASAIEAPARRNAAASVRGAA